MGNAFDFLIAAAFCATVIICYNYGIFRLLIPFRKLAAFVLAYSLKGADFINGFVGKLVKADKVKSFLHGRIDELWGADLKAAAENADAAAGERFDGVFGFSGEIFSNIKEFCISLYDKLLGTGADASADAASQVELFVHGALDYLTDVTAAFFTTLLSFIILYLFFSIAFKYGAKLLDMLFSEGFFGFLNRCMGALVGIFYGFLICWLMAIAFVNIVPLITPINVGSVVDGFFGVTEWFYTKFFASQILGMKL